MGNSQTLQVNLDHELYYQQEAIEAGKLLSGKVIVHLHETIPETGLALEVKGTEKTFSFDTAENRELYDRHSFFRVTLPLHEFDSKIAPGVYVFPFVVPLPKCLPSSKKFKKEGEGSANNGFDIEYTIRLKSDTHGVIRFNRNFLVASAPLVGDPVACLTQPEPIFVDTFDEAQQGAIFIGAHVIDTHVHRGQSLNISLACRNDSTCEINKVEVELIEEYSWTTKDKRGKEQELLATQGDAENLPGLMLMGHNPDEVDDVRINVELLARKMFKDLNSMRNELSMKVPRTAKESYDGCLINITHHVKVTLLTATENQEKQPSIKIPIRIVGDPPSMLKIDDLGAVSDHVSEKARIRFLSKRAPNDSIILGRNAASPEFEDSFSGPLKAPICDEMTLDDLFEELSMSVDDYEFLDYKMRDLEWAIFLASMTPEEFGLVVEHVKEDFAQARVAALLARNYGGDFTCAHSAEAIRNASDVFRCNMAEGLLTYCCDLSENNHLIREQLSEFEQIIVALHALDDRDQPGGPRGSPNQTRGGASGRKGVHELPPDAIKADPTDICIGNPQHPGTKEMSRFVERVVREDPGIDFCPVVFRRIKRNFKDRRFIVYADNNNNGVLYYRKASKQEEIEFVGDTYDTEKAAQQTSGSGSMHGGRQDWAQGLRQSANEWELVVTIHSYASGIGDIRKEEEKDGPSMVDVCFGKKEHHLGNSDLLKAMRLTMKQSQGADFSPSVYRSIRGHLPGRKFFVVGEDGEWREATKDEKRQNLEKIYAEEKQKGKREKKGKPRSGRRLSTQAVHGIGSNGQYSPGSLKRSSVSNGNRPKSPGRRASSPVSGRRSEHRSNGDSPRANKPQSRHSGNGNSSHNRQRKSWRGGADQSQLRHSNSNRSLRNSHGNFAESASELHFNGGTGSGAPQKQMKRSKSDNAMRGLRKRQPQKARSIPNPTTANERFAKVHTPKDNDVCFGLDTHPGTLDFFDAVADGVTQYSDSDWSPPVYKYIRAQLQGRRFFVKTSTTNNSSDDSNNSKSNNNHHHSTNVQWREAQAPERVEHTRRRFEHQRQQQQQKSSSSNNNKGNGGSSSGRNSMRNSNNVGRNFVQRVAS